MTLKERLYRFRSFWLFPLTAVVLLLLTAGAQQDSRFGDLLWLVPIGLLIWTLVEYILHRFVFHTHVAIRNTWIRGIVNASHLAHHAAPRDPNRLLVIPLYGAVISAVL